MRFVLKSDNDAIVLVGGGVGDTLGWTLTGVDGWFGSPDIRESPVGLTMEDSDYFPNTLSQGARVVTLSTALRGTSSIDIEKSIGRVNAMMGKHLTIIGETAEGYRECECYISSGIEPNISTHAQTASFDIIVTCPDPRKYGATSKYSYKPSMTIHNMGNVDMFPTLELKGRGHIEEFTYSCAGKTLRWKGYTESLTIDLQSMQASSGYFSAPVLVPIKSGGDTVDMSANVDVSGTVIVRPAWR